MAEAHIRHLAPPQLLACFSTAAHTPTPHGRQHATEACWEAAIARGLPAHQEFPWGSRS